jgi:hypothetical protein
MTNLIETKGAKITARQSNGMFERTFENCLEPFKAKVLAQVLLEPKGYSAQVRLAVESDGKKYKVSQWEETSVGAEVWVHSQEFQIGEKGKEQTRYFLVASNQAPKGE